MEVIIKIQFTANKWQIQSMLEFFEVMFSQAWKHLSPALANSSHIYECNITYISHDTRTSVYLHQAA